MSCSPCGHSSYSSASVPQMTSLTAVFGKSVADDVFELCQWKLLVSNRRQINPFILVQICMLMTITRTFIVGITMYFKASLNAYEIEINVLVEPYKLQWINNRTNI